MKKHLLKGLAIVAAMFAMEASAQTRYIEPVFSGVTKTANVMYDSNSAVNILYGQVPGIPALFSHKLKCDIYEPTGDTEAKRPLILLASTGSFIPAVANKQTTGGKNDSSIVYIATELAKRGYVVAAVEYRSGWNPLTQVEAIATEQLLQATYRGMQDMRNAIRFFRSNASTYKVDTSKIILGGQGTGGYIAYAVATVSKRSDIESNAKFLRGNGTPMVNMDTLGDWTGVGGVAYMNFGADAAVASNPHMIFNWGGAMGDINWMKANSLPMVSLQVKTDIFAPYNTGSVFVPNGPRVIPDASGAGDVIPRANNSGINNKLNTVRYVDAVSQAAMAASNKVPNLFGFNAAVMTDNAPWEWWNNAILQATTAIPYAGAPTSAPFFGYIPANGRLADSLSMLTNPNMSTAKGKAYCDTVVNFVAPRFAVQFDIAGNKTLNAFALLSPATGVIDTLRATDSSFVVARWEKSHVAGAAAGTTTYHFEMYMGNDTAFMAPLYSVPVPDGDSIAMPRFFLYASLPGPDGSVYPLKWRVVCDNGTYGRASTNANMITLVKAATVVGGMSQFSLNNFMKVYPNPSKGNLNISLSVGFAPISEVVVMDVMGREVFRANGVNAHDYSVNTSQLNGGVYFVNIVNSNGETGVSRFVVE